MCDKLENTEDDRLGELSDRMDTVSEDVRFVKTAIADIIGVLSVYMGLRIIADVHYSGYE